MLENPAPPSFKFSSTLTNSLRERSSHVAPVKSPPQKNKIKQIPLKTSVHFLSVLEFLLLLSRFLTTVPYHELFDSKR